MYVCTRCSEYPDGKLSLSHMENRESTSRASRLFPTFGSCRFGKLSDVVENSVAVTGRRRHGRQVEQRSSNALVFPCMKVPRTPDHYTEVPKLDNQEIRAKQSIAKNSSSSNGGWFSSEEEAQFDPGTSLSSDISKSFRRSRNSSSGKNPAARRRRDSHTSLETGHFPVEPFATPIHALGDFGLDDRKTMATQNKTTKYRRRNQNRARVSSGLPKSSNLLYSLSGSSHSETATAGRNAVETQMGRVQVGAKNGTPQRSSKVSAGSTYFYYGDAGDFGRKSTKPRCRGRDKGSLETHSCWVVVDGRVGESYAMVKNSSDPCSDFRASMAEMIIEKQIFGGEDLEKLLECFLKLNSAHHHQLILQVFSEICDALLTH